MIIIYVSKPLKLAILFGITFIMRNGPKSVCYHISSNYVTLEVLKMLAIALWLLDLNHVVCAISYAMNVLFVLQH